MTAPLDVPAMRSTESSSPGSSLISLHDRQPPSERGLHARMDAVARVNARAPRQDAGGKDAADAAAIYAQDAESSHERWSHSDAD